MANSVDAQASNYRDVALLVGRTLIGALFLIAAHNKVKGYGGTVGYFTNLGIPAPSIATPLSIAFEVLAGILLIIGYRTRVVALAISALCIVTALIAHTNIADGIQLNHLLKNFAIAGRMPGAVRYRRRRTVGRR